MFLYGRIGLGIERWFEVLLRFFTRRLDLDGIRCTLLHGLSSGGLLGLFGLLFRCTLFIEDELSSGARDISTQVHCILGS